MFLIGQPQVKTGLRTCVNCVDVQADLSIRCPHRPEDTFFHGTTQLLFNFI